MKSLLSSLNRILGKALAAFAVFIFISAFSLNRPAYAAVTGSGTVGTVSWKVEESKLSIYPTNGTSGKIIYSVPTSWPSGGNYWPWTQYKSSITSVEVSSGVGFSTGQSAERMFYNLSNVTSMDVTNLDTSACTSFNSMFRSCSKMTTAPDVSNWVTSACTSFNSMFYGCSSLTTAPDVSNWVTSACTSFNSMFSGCSSLTTAPDVSNWVTSACKDFSYMFDGCLGLTTIYAGDNWNTGKVSNSTKMFLDCTSLKGSNGFTYTSDDKHDKTYARIDTTDTPGYFTKKTA